MKNYLVLLTAFIWFTTGFNSCKKKTVTTTPLSVVGIWKGKATIIGINELSDVTYILRDNGTMGFYLGEDTSSSFKFEGVYSLSNRELSIEYSALDPNSSLKSYSEKCFVNEAFNHFDGTWGEGAMMSGGGLTSADKQ
jgi:hypothetical protein